MLWKVLNKDYKKKQNKTKSNNNNNKIRKRKEKIGKIYILDIQIAIQTSNKITSETDR